VERPIAALAILIGVLALSLTVVSYRERQRTGTEDEPGSAAEVLSRQLGRVERSRIGLDGSVKELETKVSALEKALAGMGRASPLDEANLGKLCDEAIRAKKLPMEGDKPEPQKDAGAGEKKAKEDKKGAGEEKKEKAKEQKKEAKKAGVEAKGEPTALGKLHNTWRQGLKGAGVNAEKMEQVVELLELERKSMLDVLRKHRGDREAFKAARAKAIAETDQRVARAVGPDDHKKYMGWRRGAARPEKAK